MKAVEGWLECRFSAFLYIFYKSGAFSSTDFLDATDEKEITKYFVIPEKELKILEVIIPFPGWNILCVLFFFFWKKNSYRSKGMKFIAPPALKENSGMVSPKT